MTDATRQYERILNTLKNGGDYKGTWAGKLVGFGPAVLSVGRNENGRKHIAYLFGIDDAVYSGTGPTAQHAIDAISRAFAIDPAAREKKFTPATSKERAQFAEAIESSAKNGSAQRGGGRTSMLVCGISISAAIRWMTLKGLTPKQLVVAVSTLPVKEQPSAGTIYKQYWCAVHDRGGKMPEMPKALIDLMEAALAVAMAEVEPKAEEEPAPKAVEKKAAKKAPAKKAAKTTAKKTTTSKKAAAKKAA